MLNIDTLSQAIAQQNFTQADLDFRSLMRALASKGHTPVSQIVHSESQPQLDDAALVQELAAIICALFVSPKSQISVPDYDALMSWQVTLSQLFYMANLPQADAAIETILAQGQGIVSSTDIFKLCLLFGAETQLAERLAPILQSNPELLLNVCMTLVWGCSGTSQSCANREWAYAMLPQLFASLSSPNYPLLSVHGIFMHSSYGFASNKHALKTSLNRLIQQKLVNLNLTASLAAQNTHLPQASKLALKTGKKVILVMLEMFNPVHSVYRVLGKSLLALKQNYTLVAIAWPTYVRVDDGFFDELITLNGDGEYFCAQEVLDIAAAYQPVATYYPSLGMTPWAIYHSNMRLAPVQFAAIGHGASSFATEIDYFVIENDIAGDIDTYSEQVVALKPGAMPFYPPNRIQYPKRELEMTQPEVLNIVCSASSMKLNYKLLQICQNVAQNYQNTAQKVAFHFFVMTHGVGLSAQSYKKLILSYVPQAKIHLATDFQTYVNQLSHMHISVSPFPYSGMNTVVDYAMLGIPGIRMQGPQVHEMIEAGMWRRMGMPEWTIVQDGVDSESAYEAALYRLIDTPGLRQTLSQQLQKEERWQVFFNGDAMQFVTAVDQMIANHQPRIS